MQLTGERDSDGELRRLHERLERLAGTVGRQLELLNLEPDDRILDAALAEMREMVDRVIRAASDVRAAASLLAEDAVDLELAALSEEMRREVQALT
ncbi:MAG: cytochrome P450, partial [Actinomycetota bacterium]|nr:cytochrome P450 [Actinomycetota bacterium]